MHVLLNAFGPGPSGLRLCPSRHHIHLSVGSTQGASTTHPCPLGVLDSVPGVLDAYLNGPKSEPVKKLSQP
jgi:hypothetical protein